MSLQRILVIEDEPNILMVLEDDLRLEGYRVLEARDGKEGFQKAKEGNFDLIILDIMLPSMDGIEILKELRKAGNRTPVLMLTARKQEVDKVLGLGLGADDYVTKPFSQRELTARVKALLRRAHGEKDELAYYSFGTVAVNFKSYAATKGDKPLDLTPLEFSLLKLFIQRSGEALSRNHILDQVWGNDVYVDNRTVDTHVGHLRKKIEDDPANPKYIVSVRSVGYRFNG